MSNERADYVRDYRQYTIKELLDFLDKVWDAIPDELWDAHVCRIEEIIEQYGDAPIKEWEGK